MAGHSVGSKEHLGQHRKSRIGECGFLACLEEEWDRGDQVHDPVKVAQETGMGFSRAQGDASGQSL